MPFLDRIRRLVSYAAPEWSYRIGLPQHRFEGSVTLRPSRNGFRYFVDRRDISPVDAYRFNLDTVLDAAESARAEHFVVSSAWGQPPSIGVTEDGLRAILHQLERMGADYPIYIAVDGRARTRIRRADKMGSSGDETSRDSPLTVHSLLFEERTGNRYGHSHGCRVEVWDDLGYLVGTTEHGTVPRRIEANRRQTPVPTTVYGRTSVTFPQLATSDPFVTDLPIDAVYLWVDGSDPEWQQRKAERMRGLDVSVRTEATMSARFIQFDELRFSLRSLERFAPWVRHVYLVTDRQRPEWLDETGTNLSVIDHTDILPATALPTFNSHALAARLHHIDGLAEHFLYLNDDMLFGRFTRPERFFHSNGVARFFLSKTLLARDTQIAHEQARLNTAQMIEARLGVMPEHVLKHAPYAMNRSVMEWLESEFTEEWKSTIHSPFRSGTDFVPEYLHHHFSYAARKSTPGSIDYDYLAFGADFGHEAIERYMAGQPMEVLCVNDQGAVPGDDSGDVEALLRLLERDYPIPSKYERGT